MAKSVDVSRQTTLDSEQWAAFVSALEKPAEPKPRLRRLFAEPSVLERRTPEA